MTERDAFDILELNYEKGIDSFLGAIVEVREFNKELYSKLFDALYFYSQYTFTDEQLKNKVVSMGMYILFQFQNELITHFNTGNTVDIYNLPTDDHYSYAENIYLVIDSIAQGIPREWAFYQSRLISY